MDNDRDILLVAILTFITVFTWIFFELVKTTKTTTLTSQTQQLISKVDTEIDTDTLDRLNLRQNY
ncbi:hypothetical protein A2Z33_02320 [Candidatus Gottesmanbacteria bacterium RBG_16_52_11]|uniref:Uncharacterized protein n=1 Tax=Candidatus Gottesmanbacteria bacterium RBG_16_52_11 TaxID=1798374 RepID=A0A1F5YMF2_9BACT|nr:MAG: hypothetical protein A2Z33_02320 [Candidatus Gottesmanbacteria bacterium RBG_16_52_11]